MRQELVVSDPTVLETLYDPLRYRLFRLLEEPRSVPELAAEVGVAANRLYYHVRRLVQSGLIELVPATGTERVY
jgi:predicted transcriptional regulator